MTAITRNTQVSLSSKLPDGHNRIGSGFIVGQDIVAGDAVCLQYVAATGTFQVFQANGAANNGNAIVHGFAAKDGHVAQLDAVTILDDVDFNYGNNLSAFCNGTYPGGPLVYLSSTVPGGIDTTPPWTGAPSIGRILDNYRIRLYANR